MSSQPFNIGEIVTVTTYCSLQEEARIIGLDSNKAVVQSNYGPFTVNIKDIKPRKEIATQNKPVITNGNNIAIGFPIKEDSIFIGSNGNEPINTNGNHTFYLSLKKKVIFGFLTGFAIGILNMRNKVC